MSAQKVGHRRRSRTRGGLLAVLLVLILGSFGVVGKAQAQGSYGLGFSAATAFAMIAAPAGGAVLVTDIGILSQLAAGKGVGAGWSIAGLVWAIPGTLASGLCLAVLTPYDGSEHRIGCGTGLAVGAVSVAISSIGLAFRRSPPRTSDADGGQPPAHAVEVQLSGQWEAERLVLSGRIVPNPSGGTVRVRSQFAGQEEDWLEIVMDQQGRFSVAVRVPPEAREVTAMAWFQGSLGFGTGRSNTVRIAKSEVPSTPAK